MRVRFSDKMMADLLTNKRGEAREWLIRLNAGGMTFQCEPRQGRVNVTFPGPDGVPVFRTYARRDLVMVPA